MHSKIKFSVEYDICSVSAFRYWTQMMLFIKVTFKIIVCIIISIGYLFVFFAKVTFEMFCLQMPIKQIIGIKPCLTEIASFMGSFHVCRKFFEIMEVVFFEKNLFFFKTYCTVQRKMQLKYNVMTEKADLLLSSYQRVF